MSGAEARNGEPDEPPALQPQADDSHLREQTLSAAQVWRGGFLDVRSDLARLPDGSSAAREYIVHPGAVMSNVLYGA